MIAGYIAMLAVGISLGLIGGGGSILTLPILVYLLGIPPAEATGYSLFIVGWAAVFGAYRYAKLGLIAYKTGFIFAAPAFLGVYLSRAFLVPALPDSIVKLASFELTKNVLIMLVFSLMMVLAASSMIKKPKENAPEKKQIPAKYKPFLIALEGIVVGALTGFVGAGGGFLIIPALVYFADLDIKYAIGTSLMIIAIKSLLGFLGDIGQHTIDWGFLVVVTGISVVGIFIGSALVKYVSSAKLKKTFGWFVLVMGVFILAMQASQ